MRNIVILIASLGLLILSGASGFSKDYSSRFLVGGDGYKLERDDAIVILFSHGSNGDDKRDPCYFTIGKHTLDQYFGTFRMPLVFEEMADNGLPVALFYICHREIGDEGARKEERRKKWPCTKVSGNRSAKFCKRIKKIEAELKKIKAANPKLPVSRIFLSGASSGGWTSLMLLRKKPRIANGVIAFAPATNGKLGKKISSAQRKPYYDERKCGPDAPVDELIPGLNSKTSYFLHLCQQKYIADKVPSALVFSFKGDPYNPPELLPMFQAVPERIKFHAINRAACGRARLGSSHPHACFQMKFFANEHMSTIENYLKARMAGDK